MIIEKAARDTLTAVELDVGDELHFTLADGQTREILIHRTLAYVYETNLEDPKVGKIGGRTLYIFQCSLRIDGVYLTIRREVASQRSFYEPLEFMGLRIWLDAVDDIFDLIAEDHGDCRPRKKARLAVQDATKRICPPLLHPWCPLPEGGLRIEDCYEGEDCWLGAYEGTSAHGGLDINHPAGTPIWAPIDIHDHYLFDSQAAGANNNRWRGVHNWPDGSAWILGASHVIRILVDEHQPFSAGVRYADGAGVHIGHHEHSHFVFKVREPGASEDEEILLDPWILFWQMYADRRTTTAK